MTLRTRRAFTLFEVILAIALIALLLSFLLNFFWQTIEVRERVKRDATRQQIIHQVVGRIADELRAAVAIEQFGFEQMQQFVGDRRSISFVTTPLPADSTYKFVRESENPPVFKHDLMQVSYELWIDPEEETDEGDPIVVGILRTQQQALDPYETEADLPEGEDVGYLRRDLWSYELGYLEFRYFDGAEWTTTWNVAEGNRLPHLIQITVGFDSLTQEEYDDQDLEEYPIDMEEYPLGPPDTNPDRYSVLVRLPAADEMFSARMNRMQGNAEEIYDWAGEAAPEEDASGGPQ